MTAPPGRALLHLAAALDRRAPHDAVTPVQQAQLAERGALDFVTLGDTFARPGLDALAVLSRAAPVTGRIGLVPTVTTTHTEPFHVQAAVATLDWVSRGRAGWQIEVSRTEAEARLFGRGAPELPAHPGRTRPFPSVEALWREAGEVADVAARLWDSREDDTGTREGTTDRPARRNKVHQVDFEGATFSVKGPSTVPRPPQGHPVRVVDATGGPARRTAARYADVALVRVTGPAEACAVRAELRAAAAGFGRDPDDLRVLAGLGVDLGGGECAAEPGHGGGGPRLTARGPLYRGGPVGLAELITDWHRAGAADGFHLTPVEPRRDLERLVNATVPLLQHRGLFRTFYPGSTLREHLGLTRPANRYATAGGTS
ncbi:LLM class flavin-dependent oxidoreductase [Streptomyces sp. NPDC005236]|uniref:LLM class flavin-dependent oxidoreductase n=1 Tax=Streptomyces sp. NPDC005236 TaxID=3157028 RepID=UPI0033A39A2C